MPWARKKYKLEISFDSPMKEEEKKDKGPALVYRGMRAPGSLGGPIPCGGGGGYMPYFSHSTFCFQAGKLSFSGASHFGEASREPPVPQQLGNYRSAHERERHHAKR